MRLPQPQKIIIVGATSGIGREMARIYAQRNDMVGITGRRSAMLDALQEEFPGRVITRCFDVREPGSQQHIAALIAELGGLDLLIYNAGYGEPLPQLDWETENRTTQTNVNGFVEVVHYAFNYFVRQGQGQIALTSSVAALRGNSWAPAYSASKAFMSNYAEGLNIKASRLGKNIVVSDIRPGFVNTKIAKGNGRFWVAPPRKAALQIVAALDKRKRVAYITKRWWLVALILKVLPFPIYKRLA